MRNIAVLAIVEACYFGMLFAAKPMEALDRYNVVLIHGAAPEGQGFVSKCDVDSISDAYSLLQSNINTYGRTHWNLGKAVGMLGDYDRREIPDSSDSYNENSLKKLTYWLDSAVFEDYQYRNGKIYMDSVNLLSSPYIYIQRSFVNPAESPAHNAHEIGDRTWKGDNKCSVRRSLFEEAQEVRAKGALELQRLRKSSEDEYRAIP